MATSSGLRKSSRVFECVFVSIVLSFGICAAPGGQLPYQLQARFDGGFGHAYSLKLQGKELLYTDEYAGDVIEKQRVFPTAEQWLTLRRGLDAAQVWKWKRCISRKRLF